MPGLPVSPPFTHTSRSRTSKTGDHGDLDPCRGCISHGRGAVARNVAPGIRPGRSGVKGREATRRGPFRDGRPGTVTVPPPTKLDGDGSRLATRDRATNSRLAPCPRGSRQSARTRVPSRLLTSTKDAGRAAAETMGRRGEPLSDFFPTTAPNPPQRVQEGSSRTLGFSSTRLGTLVPPHNPKVAGSIPAPQPPSGKQPPESSARRLLAFTRPVIRARRSPAAPVRGR